MQQIPSHNEELLARLQHIQLCIITANAQELDVIRKNFRNPFEHVRFLDPFAHAQDIYIGSFTLGDEKSFPFYITSCSGQDTQSFAVESTYLFIHLKPKYAIHAGVCAGAGTLDNLSRV
jgi:hypothetical protein